MIVRFAEDWLRELYEKGECSDKHHRFQPQVVSKYALRVTTLQNSARVEALYPLHSLNYKVLTGDKKGISSIRIDDKYRLEFTVHIEDTEPSVTICTIKDISNHYD